MAMKSLNIKIDEDLYEIIRTIGFMNKKPMAVVVREFLQEQVEAQAKETKKKLALILEEEDAKGILDILKKDEWISEEEFMKDNNLKYNT